jgi:MoxR-like ATPase
MLTALRAALQAATIEREDEITALLLSLIAREHALLVGPPGTGKSYLCRSLAAGIEGARYVERLLSPTTPPEAVWGPISLSALREDRYEHVTTGSVADAEIVYLDEVGRASAAILDSLLHLLGPERQALLGTVQVQAPLVSAIGSANTWPEDAALLDRWLLRRVVRPISSTGREALLWSSLPAVSPVVTLSDLAAAHTAAAALPVSDAAKEALAEILDALAGAGIRPSDRRCRAAVKIARAAAVLDGANEVQRAHLEPLSMVLWDQPEQAEQATEIVTRIANPVGARLIELLRECDEAAQSAGSAADTRVAAAQKLGDILAEAKKLVGPDNGRAAKVVKHVQREHVRLQALMLGIDASKAEALLGG